MKRPVIICAFILSFLSAPAPALTAERGLTVAAASNVAKAAKEISDLFEAGRSVKVRVVSGPTGKLYAQIIHGAPFHVLLAADSDYPRMLENKGLARPGSRFTYATGVLALWINKDPGDKKMGITMLEDKEIKRIAVANPSGAPYGKAAIEAFKKSGIHDAVKDKLVYGQSVQQAFYLARSGNADAALVCVSTLHGEKGGSHYIIDRPLYSPIAQQAVALVDAPEEAKEFLDFLKGPEAGTVLRKYGYLPGDESADR